VSNQGPCWLEGPSAGHVRDAVRRVAPYLSGEVRLNDMLPSSNPFWQRGTAWLGMQHVVKFAWSEAAAAELDRERRVLLALAQTPFRRWLPPIEATAERPLLIITRRVEGTPWAEGVLDDRGTANAFADDLADAFATLHQPAVLAAATRAADLPEPTPQADTRAIRERLHRFVDPAHVRQIRRWCDWVDAVQADRAGERVLVVSGRLGFEIVQKALRAGVPLLAAVGAPSTLALRLAARAGMTVAGFLRDARCNVYTTPERIG